jgi:hypothetical protein
LETGTTIGIVGICHGYEQKIHGWLQSIRQLNRKPDEVVLVLWSGTDRTDLDLDGIKVIDWDGDFAYSDMFNLGIANCDTDWIAWIGIDDRYRPHALDQIDYCGADVLALGFEYDTGQVWTPAKTTPEQILSLSANFIPSGSPFRKWLWEKIPLDETVAPWSDWVFWCGTALLNATYESTHTIDVDYEYAGHWVPNNAEAMVVIPEWIRQNPYGTR